MLQWLIIPTPDSYFFWLWNWGGSPSILVAQYFAFSEGVPFQNSLRNQPGWFLPGSRVLLNALWKHVETMIQSWCLEDPNCKLIKFGYTLRTSNEWGSILGMFVWKEALIHFRHLIGLILVLQTSTSLGGQSGSRIPSFFVVFPCVLNEKCQGVSFPSTWFFKVSRLTCPETLPSFCHHFILDLNHQISCTRTTWTLCWKAWMHPALSRQIRR